MVKNLTEYGAFIDLGGIDGLLHVSDMSYGRVNASFRSGHAGDEITVKVLKFDKEKERISLGLKQLVPDPWETIEERYPHGRARDRPRGQRDRLRRVCRAGAWRRRSDPHLRDDLEPAHEASEQSGQGRRPGGIGGARRETQGPPRFARDQATRSRIPGPP